MNADGFPSAVALNVDLAPFKTLPDTSAVVFTGADCCRMTLLADWLIAIVGWIDLSLSKYALRLTRRDLRILIGLLTGHTDLN